MSHSDLAIRVEALSKSYTIRHQGPAESTLTETMLKRLRRPFAGSSSIETFWALKDVSFDVKKGDVVGVIGRNGAGKSTLLKILSRITEPTSGRIEIFGRIGSLLEVGTGFHPELTGRENIFLNGNILGMSRAEIRKQFDAIVDFSGVEKFLDTPVKRYSSGMYVRLAFAVAAHLSSDILVVDEVLAVGDGDFQKKCIGKMQDVADGGRTVLFVSHNMTTIMRLCRQALLLERGQVAVVGSVNDAVNRYMHSGAERPSERLWLDIANAPGDSVARLRAVRVLDASGNRADTIEIRSGGAIEVEYDYTGRRDYHATVVLHFIDDAGTLLFSTADFNNLQWRETPRQQGRIKVACRIPGNLLAEGQISVLVAVCHYNPDIVHAIESDAVRFHVVDHSEGDGVRGKCAQPWPGVVRPMLQWDVRNGDSHASSPAAWLGASAAR